MHRITMKPHHRISQAGQRALLTFVLALGALSTTGLFPGQAAAACNPTYEDACVTAPFNLSASVQGTSSIQLNWAYEASVQDPEGTPVMVEVRLGLATRASFPWDAQSPRTSYLDTGLAPGTYTYQICNVFALAQGDPVTACSWAAGATISGSTPPPPPPAPPAAPQLSDVRAEILSYDAVKVTWRVTGATSIKVERTRAAYIDNQWKWGTDRWWELGGGVTHLTDTSVAPFTTYHYLVTACNTQGAVGSCTPRVTDDFRTPPGSAQAPQNVVVSAVSGLARLTWSTGDDSIFYFEVERNFGPGDDGWKPVSGRLSRQTLSFTDPASLDQLHNRSYRVCAQNITGRTCSGTVVLLSPVAGLPPPGCRLCGR